MSTPAAPVAVEVRCRAKVNARLEVLRRREDGYHDLDTELLALELHDVLSVRPGRRGFELAAEGPRGSLVGGPDDLVLRAARLLQGEVGEEALPGATFHLTKRVPVAAGLGGGSSDAAGTLVGLARAFHLELGSERLADLALDLGSDVPYFLAGGRQRARSRGERLEGLPEGPDRPVLLAHPPVPLSTARVFAVHDALREGDRNPGSTSEEDVLTKRKMGRRLISTPWKQPSGSLLRNDLWPAALQLEPRLADWVARLAACVPAGEVGLSGSGPTLFVLGPAGTPADEAFRAAAALGGELELVPTRTVGREEYHAAWFVESPLGSDRLGAEGK